MSLNRCRLTDDLNAMSYSIRNYLGLLFVLFCAVALVLDPSSARAEILEEKGKSEVVVLPEHDGAKRERSDQYINYSRDGVVIFQIRNSSLKMIDSKGREADLGSFSTLICYVDSKKVAELPLTETGNWIVQSEVPISVETIHGLE